MTGWHPPWIAPALALMLVATSSAWAAPPPPPAAKPEIQQFICPIDGGRATAQGHDGRPSPKRYSDFEMPTRAYTNLVVACPKCGYAAWTHDFERHVGGGVSAFVHQHLKPTAKRAAAEPAIAYKHHMNLLHYKKADVREQIGVGLFYTYVLKRKRPWGGLDPALERRIVGARKRALMLIKQTMKSDPPRTARGRLEWRYLIGELSRLTGAAKVARPILDEVCKSEEAGITVRRLACEMAERARRGDTSEDYRDGKFDLRGIAGAEERSAALKKAAAKADAKDKSEAKAEAAAKKAPEDPKKRPLPPPNVQLPQHNTRDKYAPPPPPPAK